MPAGRASDAAKYELIKSAILNAIDRRGQIGLDELLVTFEDKLGKTFDGNVSWYTMAVKLDLEARGTIERVPNETPQQLRMKE